MAPGPPKQFDTDHALRQAMGVFWSHGYEAASMADLTGAMGIGKKSLYDTYGNKRELFLEALDLYAATQGGQIGALLQAPGSPLRNVYRVLDRWGKMGREPGARGCLLGNNMADFDESDPEIAERIMLHMGRLEDALADTLRRAKEQGELTEDASPRDLARMLVCLTQGAALVSRVAGGGPVFAGAIRAAKQLLSA